MNFLFISSTSRSNIALDPSVLYRCIHPARFVNSRPGWKACVTSLNKFINEFEEFRSTGVRSDLMTYAFSCKKIIFHRPIFSISLAFALETIKNLGIDTAADYDDFVFSVENYMFTSAFEKIKSIADEQVLISSISKFEECLNLFSSFTVSTPQLAGKLRETYSGGKAIKIHRIPNVPPMAWIEMAEINYHAYMMQKNPYSYSSRSKTVGYFGGTASHNQDFNIAKQAIIDFLKLNSSHKFLYCSVAFNDFANEDSQVANQIHSFRPVCYNEMVTIYDKVDICIAPLKYSEFNKCKSSLKFFEAALFGKPVVASFNPSIVERYEQSSLLFVVTEDDSFLTQITNAFSLMHDSTSKYVNAWRAAIDLITNEIELAQRSVINFME